MTWNETDERAEWDHLDNLNAARGIVNGCWIGCILYLAVAAVLLLGLGVIGGW